GKIVFNYFLYIEGDVQVIIVFGNLFQRTYFDKILYIGKCAVPVKKLLYVLRFQEILRSTYPDLIGSVDKEYLSFSVCRFILLEYHHARRQLGAIEDIGS